MIIKPPNILDDDGAIIALNDIEMNKNCADMGYQFGDLKFVFPFGTLLLAEKIRQISVYRHEKRIPNRIVDGKYIRETQNTAGSYLKYFGFFKYIGADIGEDYNRQVRKSNYTPINAISIDMLTKQIGVLHWTESIEKKCEGLASIISKNMQASIQISYCFREIMRNVFEHSESDRCTLMAQYYPYLNMVEISILDSGIGIVESLRPTLGENVTNVEILERSLVPGISSKRGNGYNSKWANTGFGLYILSELGKRLGEFSILANGTYLKYYEQDKKIAIDRVAYSGTAIKLRISLENVDYFPNILKSIVEKGENLTEEIFGERITASSMSKKSGNIRNS